jgi:hypothetical protein
MLIVEWLIEVLFFTCCGWVGYIVVKVITLGKVELEYGDSSESFLTQCIGFIFILAVILLFVELIR